MNIAYSIDNNDFSIYGVHVSSSDGLIGRPKPKEPVSQSWPDYHGKVIDLSNRYYEERKISLECFIKADGLDDFLKKFNSFTQLFDLSGTRRLKVTVDPSRPLVFEVYLSGELDPKKKWNETLMVGTFKLELTEPSPIKRVVQFNGKSASITITSTKLVNIYWGDGTVTSDISGTNVVSTHAYSQDWTYYAIVAGNIDEITAFTTTGRVLWSKL